MRIEFTPAAREDVLSQGVRYYALEAGVPDIGLRFVDAVERTVARIVDLPEAGAAQRLQGERLHDVRARAVTGFDRVRVAYRVSGNVLSVIRVLHDRRDPREILVGPEAVS